jgi:hypothetical protein
MVIDGQQSTWEISISSDLRSVGGQWLSRKATFILHTPCGRFKNQESLDFALSSKLLVLPLAFNHNETAVSAMS